MTDDQLYRDMHVHPALGPVFQLLDMVEPVDEFSRALCLLRDCFSPTRTLRHLSREQLKTLMKRRMALVGAHQMAVLAEAKRHGIEAEDVGAALAQLPKEVADDLTSAFRRQVNELMGRPLK